MTGDQDASAWVDFSDPVILYINYAPEFDQWGALWTYNVKVSQPLIGTRKVDSIIKTDLCPGQMLQLFKNTNSH